MVQWTQVLLRFSVYAVHRDKSLVLNPRLTLPIWGRRAASTEHMHMQYGGQLNVGMFIELRACKFASARSGHSRMTTRRVYFGDEFASARSKTFLKLYLKTVSNAPGHIDLT